MIAALKYVKGLAAWYRGFQGMLLDVPIVMDQYRITTDCAKNSS
jgi:hypothetical protein